MYIAEKGVLFMSENRKIFVSYKYWDRDVEYLQGYSDTDSAKVRDYVTWLEDKLNNRTGHIYKGESDNEDLSKYSDSYIENKLKDRLFDSSVTIVLISPNMKVPYRKERDQWIPWEIQYSIRNIYSESYISRRNAILAVILPDKNGKYEYSSNLKLFRILEHNIDCQYIPVFSWNTFKYCTDECISKAVKAKENIDEKLLKLSI